MYHFNLVDKLRETFIGKSQEELEKQKAFVRLGGRRWVEVEGALKVLLVPFPSFTHVVVPFPAMSR